MAHSTTEKKHVKHSISLEEDVSVLVDKLAGDLGMSRSCVIGLALRKPEKFAQLVRTTDDEKAAMKAAVKEEPGLIQQFLDFLDTPVICFDDDELPSESEAVSGEKEVAGEIAAVATKKEVPWYDQPILGEEGTHESEDETEGKSDEKEGSDEEA